MACRLKNLFKEITISGKVNSLFGVCEAIVPLVYGPMYSSIYGATVNNFPGTFFLVGGGLMIPGVIAFL